jgi:D-amino-acid dehydrogenase
MSGNGSDPASKVTVIGAGIVGIACASYLRRDGHEVTVIDRLPPGEGCSKGNAGCLSPGSVIPLAGPGVLRQVPSWLFDPLGPLALRGAYLPRALPWLLRFARAGAPEALERGSAALRALHQGTFENYTPLLEAAGAEDLIRRTGQLHVYSTEEGFLGDAAGWARRRALGVVVEELDRSQIRQMEPALAPIFARAVYLPEHGHTLDPWRLVQRLADGFVREGGRVLRREVRDLEVGPGGSVQLRTDQGAIEAGTLVIAAGAWSHRLAARLGDRVPLESQRGYHVTVADPGVEPRMPVMWGERKFMITPMQPGLRFAGTVEFAGLEAPPDYRRARVLLKHGKEVFPDLKAERGSEWMGHRPCLPDSLPVIGRAPRVPSVLYAFGHGHTGLSGASTTGRVIADLVAGRPPAIDVTPFRADRF